MLDGWGNRGRNGKDGKPGKSGRLGGGGDTGRTRGKPGAPKGRLARAGARLGGLGSKALAAGAGILGVGSLFGGAGATEAATSAVATRAAVPATSAAGKSTGLLGKVGAAGAKAGALGAKAAGGVARAIPVIGQVLAVGMAAYDGVQGWNDSELHQNAFGLADGEEASTGQKASASVASVLDMGGLLTGLAGLAGFEFDTADIASGIYTAGSTVTGTVVEAWDAVGGTISTASAAAGATISQAWDAASSGMSEAAAGAWSAISDAATAAWDKTSTAVAEAATGAWDSVTEGTVKAWDSASTTASNAIAATSAAVSSAWDSTSSAVGGVVTDAWDSVAGGASSAWAGVTGFFSDDKPEARTSEQAAQSSAAVVQAVAAQPATTLLGTPKPSTAQTPQEAKEKDEDELGVDAVVVPDEKMEGLFGTLTEAVTGLSQAIKDEIKRKELESGGAFSAVGGLVSGVSTWMKDRLSNMGGGGEGGNRGGSVNASATGGTSTRYAYDPNAKIGEAIVKYESGTGGSSTIGYDRTGGTSYGKYQLASNADSMEGFLKMMEGKGGEHAAIASRLRAAGPANTGSKNGKMPEQWKKEASANGELLKSAELEYMLKANYAPAMQGLGEGVRGKVENSKALQEAMFSTAVQHGPGRTSGIWNKVYKDGMSDEELIRAVYSERATRFGSSTPQIQESARRRMASEQELILSMRRGESSSQSIASAVQNSPQDQVVQAAASTVIQASTQDAVNRGVKYDFGSKNSQRGGIDCSGWVAEVNRNLMEAVNATMGQEVYGTEAKRVLAKGANGGAAGIIQAMTEATGQQLGNADLSPDKIREGMMIGMDTGQKGWDSGRYKGIDHIVQTYRDEVTGQMMVSESSGGKGVHATPYDEWYAKWGEKAKLYGTDVTQLADASKIGKQPQATAVATSSANGVIADALPAGVPTVVTTASQQSPPLATTLATAQMQGHTPVTATTPVATAIPKPQTITVESVGDIAPPQNTGSNTLQMAGVEKLLQGILSVLSQQSKNNTPNGSEGPPHINMDFDDQTAYGLAHDRA